MAGPYIRFSLMKRSKVGLPRLVDQRFFKSVDIENGSELPFDSSRSRLVSVHRIHKVNRYFRDSATWSWTKFDDIFQGKNENDQGKDMYMKSLNAIIRTCDKECFMKTSRERAEKLLNNMKNPMSL